jgi:hypothetical protein
VSDADKQLDVSVDYGNLSGRFVRVDVTLRSDSLYPSGDGDGDGGSVSGFVALSADEAVAFADLLRDRAGRIVAPNRAGQPRPQP